MRSRTARKSPSISQAPLRKRIVYTRNDGGVTVNCPAPRIFAEMQRGAWGHRPRGWVDYQVEMAIKDGRDPAGVKRFAMAMVKGGVTEKDCWAIIRDRDTLHKGRLHELQNLEDLPDRWFRNAWRRSHNGGPVGIDLEIARVIQWDRLTEAADEANKRRTLALRPLSPIEIDALRAPIERAHDTDELWRIWPEALSRPTQRPSPTPESSAR